ncbi:hypothetical protein [Prosthecobacter sp.]
MTKTKTNIILIAVASLLASCAAVDITKTGQGYYDPIPAAQVEILKTKPDRSYVELATLDVAGFTTRQTAKMHNAIRAKAGPIGANAVIITDESVIVGGFGAAQKFASAVAIRYK